jgi:hypothetical protein
VKFRRVVAGVAIFVFAFGAWQAYGAYRLHQRQNLEDDPNPVAAHPVALVHTSLERPVPFQSIVVDGKTLDNGRKPKVIIDPDGVGAVVGAQVGMKGFALYRRGRGPQLISRYGRGRGAEDAQAADLDGDGAPDIVVGGLDGITNILHNPRHSGECTDPYRCPWKSTTLDTGHPSHDVVVGDVDHDGHIDVATESGIYLNRDRASRWRFIGRDLIPRDGQGTSLADLEGDGILDVIAPYRSGTILARFVNPLHHHGDPTHDQWQVQPIDEHPLFSGNMTTAVADLNGDGRNDIVLAPMYGGGGLVWYEAPVAPGGTWRRHVIDATVNFVHQGSLKPTDLDDNGRPDIAFAEQDQSPTRRVGVFYNVAGDGSRWRLQVLSTNGGQNIKVGRIENDGQPSIVSARHGYFGGPNPLIEWRDDLRGLAREVKR